MNVTENVNINWIRQWTYYRNFICTKFILFFNFHMMMTTTNIGDFVVILVVKRFSGFFLGIQYGLVCDEMNGLMVKEESK